MTKRLWIVVLILSACTSARTKRADLEVPLDRAPSSLYSEISTDPDFDQILSVIRRAGATTVDQALGAINRAFPGYLHYYALVYESFSVQKATFLKPRVIVNGKHGRTYLTFNDRDADGGQGAIESLTYDNRHHAHFREIAFRSETPDAERLKPEEIDPANSFAGVDVSKDNIGKCIQCHLDNHAIWGNYLVWAGNYGSFDDNTFRPEHRTQGRTAFAPRQNREFAEYEKYRANVAGRYRHLKPIPPAPSTLGLDQDISFRRNLKINQQLVRETMAELADDIVALRPPREKLISLVATVKCFGGSTLDADTLAQTIREDGAASLEVLAQMKRNFAPAKFIPDKYLAYNPPKQFQTYFPRVSKTNAQLAGQGISTGFDETANFTWRLKNIGLDSHRYFINLRRTSLNDGAGFSQFANVLVRRLIETDPGGSWERYDKSNVDGELCAPATRRI